MAFQPSQFLTNFDEVLKEFENYFDDKLAQHKVDKYDTFVDVPIPKGYSEAHHKELQAIYYKAGWSLIVYSNARVRFYAKN
jgi:hypothetical protein